MLTLFTTAKPFRGHFGIIQRNALKSWTLLGPDVEVILFGDDEGSAEVAQEMGLRYEPNVERTEFGAMRLDSMFGKAQAMARHDVLCYVNCDIILMSDFRRAVERVRAKYKRFLMVGRRWDTPITQPLDFHDPEWSKTARDLAVAANAQRNEYWIDYFAFSRSVYSGNLAPLGIGRMWWDQWLLWRALEANIPVVNVSAAVMAVHQNHDYSHHPLGWRGVWESEEGKQNLRLLGGPTHLRAMWDATAILGPGGFARNPERYWRALIKPWLLRDESDEFQRRWPGRFRYFVHRCRFNLAHGGGMTRTHLAYMWALAFTELLVGLSYSHYLEGVRTRARRLLDYLGRRMRPASGDKAA